MGSVDLLKIHLIGKGEEKMADDLGGTSFNIISHLSEKKLP